MDTKALLNDSSIHHGRNLVCLMNRKGFKVEDLEKALQLSQKQVEELMEMKKEAGEFHFVQSLDGDTSRSCYLIDFRFRIAFVFQ